MQSIDTVRSGETTRSRSTADEPARAARLSATAPLAAEAPTQPFTALPVAEPILPDVRGPSQPLGPATKASHFWDTQTVPMATLQSLGLLMELVARQQQLLGKSRTSNTFMFTNLSCASQLQRKEQVQGERASAKFTLKGSAAVAVAGIVAAGVGASLSNNPTGYNVRRQQIAGSTLTAMSQLINSVGTQAIRTVDTVRPGYGKFRADEARIAQAAIDIQVQRYRGADDQFNGSYENARKLFENLRNTIQQTQNEMHQTCRSVAQNI